MTGGALFLHIMHFYFVESESTDIAVKLHFKDISHTAEFRFVCDKTLMYFEYRKYIFPVLIIHHTHIYKKTLLYLVQ